MNNLYAKITAIVLTILVLFSSSFIIIDKHYCEGKLKHFSLFGKAGICDMDMPTCEVENPNLAVLKDTCCSSSQQFKIANIFRISPDYHIDFQQLITIPDNTLHNEGIYVSLTNNHSYYKDYSPPLITRNILVFIQCFRV